MSANEPKNSQEVKLHFSGGLGNQLFQFAFLEYLISIGVNAQPQFGCMPLRVDPSGRPWIESVVNFENSIHKTSILKSFAFRRMINVSLLIRSFTKDRKFKLSNFEESITRIPYGRIVNELGSVTEIEKSISGNVFGYFQSSEWASKREIRDRILLAKHDSDLINLSTLEKPLIVHVRLGDYEENPQLGILPKSYYFEAIRECFNKFDHGAIWLFSDNPSTALGFIPEKFKHLVRILDSPRDTPPETLNKMRYGYAYVLANSSLSWWSANLSIWSNPHVIAPSPWFRALDEPKNLFPREWQIKGINWRN